MKHVGVAFLLIFAAAMSRLLPHPPNFTPLVAMALAGGVYLDRRFAFFVPVVAMLLSDLVIGFHATMLFVYGSFVLVVIVGIWLRSHKKPLPILAGALVSSLMFFVITNFGVWIAPNGMYPGTLDGLIACYVAALPFLRNTVFGALAYTGVLFGLFELAAFVVGKMERRLAISREQ